MKNFWVLLALLAAALPLPALERAAYDRKYMEFEKSYGAGNYRAAAGLGRELLTGEVEPNGNLPLRKLFRDAAQSLFELGNEREFDRLLVDSLARHPDSPEILTAAAELQVPAYGRIVNDEFVRGRGDHGDGEVVNSAEVDRLALLKRFAAALPEAEKLPASEMRQDFFRAFSGLLLRNREAGSSWRLQELTALDRASAFNVPSGPYIRYAPADDDGNPVLYPLAPSFAAARNDGERYRWALAEAGDTLKWADFLESQIGLATLDSGDWADRAVLPGGEESLRALGDDESIAHLVCGVRRFPLKDEYNPLKLYEAYLASHPDSLTALDRLAGFRIQRCQFDRAAALLARYRKISADNQSVNERYRQLTAPLLHFENRGPFTVGEKMTADFFFRNAGEVEFSIQEVNFDALWKEWRDTVSRPSKEGEAELTGNFAFDAIPLLNAKPARPERSWNRTLEGASDHSDRKGAVDLPALSGGFYLLSAEVKGGNRAQMLFAVNSLIFWSRPGAGAAQFFVVDAVSGEPVEGARISTYRLEQQYARSPAQLTEYRGRVRAKWLEAEGVSGRFGQAAIPVTPYRHGWTVVRSADGKAAAWTGQFFGAANSGLEQQRLSAYFIADRPIYRPGETIELECYLRKAGYDVVEPEKDCSYRKLQVEIHSPRGSKVLDRNYTTSSFGSFSVSLPTGPDAELGMYRVSVRDGHHIYGNTVCRVEEFIKPEYKVLFVAPDVPVGAGEKITANVRADYYFGAPVADAEVKVKVTRSAHQASPFFRGPWDWLYGAWYWRCSTAWDFGGSALSYQPPELILETGGRTDSNGEFKVEVETALLGVRYGAADSDLRFEAEVTDSARKPVNASGNVIVAANPFRLFAYTACGFFAPGETVRLQIAPRTPDGKPIAGKGEVKIYRQTLENGVVKQQEPALRTLEFASDGKAEFITVPFALAESGVFAACGTLTADDGSRADFSLPVRVTGEKLPGEGLFSELPLEISTDRAEYRVGDKAWILFNSRFPSGTFFVFIRSNGAADDFRVLHFNEHAEVLTLDIDRSTQPNFFIEVVLVSGGKLYREQKEIVVPPEKKILNVAVKTPETKVRPGMPGSLEIFVTDSEGKSVRGSVTVSIYDAALDGVPGAVMAPELHRFFWGWKRYFQSQLAGNFDVGPFLFSDQSVEPLFPPSGMEREYSWGLPRQRGLKTKSAGAPLEAAFASGASESNDAAAGAETGGDVSVRSEFFGRILWVPRRVLESDGSLKLKFSYPDNLTTWKIKVWSFADGLRVGEGETEVIVSKEIIARLSLPRFMVEGDASAATAIVHNYGTEPRTLKVTLKVPDNVAVLSAPSNEVVVPPQGKAVLEWQVSAVRPGEAEFILSAAAAAAEGGDALRETIEIKQQGALQLFGFSGILDGDQAEESFEIPATARPGSVRFSVNAAPSSAMAMLELLPWLAGKGPKNVFSIAASFAPALAARDAMRKAGVPPELFGKYKGNYAELAGGRDRAELWSSYRRNPLDDNAELEKAAADSVKMLEGIVNSDGGWGWFSGRNETSYPDTTVEAVEALLQAKSSGIAVREEVLKRAGDYLSRIADQTLERWKNQKGGPGNIDARVLLALTRVERYRADLAQLLFEQRTNALTPFGIALLGEAMTLGGDRAGADALLVNLEQYYQSDDRNQSGFLKVPHSLCFWWYGDDVMTQAAYLRLLLAAKPDDSKVPRLANYIVRNLRNAPSRVSIRSLGAGVTALGAFLEKSGELAADETVEVFFDGTSLRKMRFAGDSIWQEKNSVEVPGDLLTAGKHTVTIRRSGRGRAYWAAYLSYYNQAAQITPAGKELTVERVLYRVVPQVSAITVADDKARPTTAAAESVRLERLLPGEDLPSGAELEVELNIKSSNDFDYVVVADPRAGGTEPVNPVSGPLPGRYGVYAEYGLSESRFYLHRLGRGENQIRYRLRARQPGAFQALAPTATGVYAPELRSNGESEKIGIKPGL